MPFFSQHPARVLNYQFVQRTKVYKLKDAEIDMLKRFVKKVVFNYLFSNNSQSKIYVSNFQNKRKIWKVYAASLKFSWAVEHDIFSWHSGNFGISDNGKNELFIFLANSAFRNTNFSNTNPSINSIKDALNSIKFHIVYCELRNQKQPLAYSWALMTPPITEFFELLQSIQAGLQSSHFRAKPVQHGRQKSAVLSWIRSPSSKINPLFVCLQSFS